MTPVAVYATWATGDPDHELPSGDHWAHDAVYEVRDGSTPLGSIPVDQSLAPGSNDPPEPNDRPWTLLGVWNVPFGHTLTVVLYNGSDSAHPDPGGVVCVSDVMIHPLWPTVSIRSTDVTVNSKVASANDGIYEDWFDACNPIEPPVEGSGTRTELQLAANVEQTVRPGPRLGGFGLELGGENAGHLRGGLLERLRKHDALAGRADYPRHALHQRRLGLDGPELAAVQSIFDCVQSLRPARRGGCGDQRSG